MQKIYEAIDRVWGWISEKVFVRFEFDLPVEHLKQIHATSRLVFATCEGGLIEWLILSSWCRSQGLGAVLVANRMRILMLSKPLYFLQILFRRRRYADLFMSQEPGPRFLLIKNTERKALFIPTQSEQLLSDLCARLSAKPNEKNLHLVPVVIRWRKHVRGERRHASEYLLGLSSNPNILGKLWYLARKRSDSLVRALQDFALPFQETPEGSDVIDEGTPMRIAKSVRRKVLVLNQQEMRVGLGPRYSSPLQVKETLMRDPDIQKAITDYSAQINVDRKKGMMVAYQYLTEIVATYAFRFIELMYVLLTWLFNKVFDGVDTRESDFHRLREVLKHKPVVFVSCHRSHLDYLVLPYILYLHDIVTPHIAAGVNLSFWPVGYFLRKGGAFFIRRSFRGNALYSICLRKYVEYLIKNRYNMKFFIEGTRSRSGKMLAPAYGILKMVFQSYESKAVEDIAFIPISICYDEVLEQSSYTKELAGGAKEQESTKALLKSSKIVKRKIGKVYVRMAEPLYIKELTAQAAGMDSTLLLQKTAFQLCKNINDETPVTPKSVASTVLLTSWLFSVSLEDLLRQTSLIEEYLHWAKRPISVTDSFRSTMEQTVRRMQKTGVVAVSDSVPRGFYVERRYRALLNFYKNNGIHCLVSPAITMLSLLIAIKRGALDGTMETFQKKIKEAALSIRNLMKFEFFFNPTAAFIDEIESCVGFFAKDARWTSKTPDEVVQSIGKSFEHHSDLNVFVRLLGDLFEGYWVAVKFLIQAGESQFDRKSLNSMILKSGQDQSLGFPEGATTQNISNALLLMENLELLELTKDKDAPQVIVGRDKKGLEGLERQLTEFLAVINENPENLGPLLAIR